MEINYAKNPWDIKVGDIITAYNAGIHEVLSIDTEKDTWVVEYNQVYSIDGKKVNMHRPAICAIEFCRPAINYLPKLRERIEGLRKLETYLDNLRKALKD